MFSNYTALFQIPGTRGFCLSGFIARLPIGMISIGIITMLSQIYNSYWLAGTVAGAYTFSTALIAPQISKLVDRFGQYNILRYVAVMSISSLIIFLIAVHFDAPTPLFYILAMLAGCLPNMSAMVRARWTHIYRGTHQLHTAFSLESVLDEICFIIGPTISVGLSVGLFPEAGVLFAAILFIIGVTSFILQRKSEPPVTQLNGEVYRSVFSYVRIRVVLIVLLNVGIIAGVIDVVSIAFAKEQGVPIAATVILALYSISSCLSGILFGAIRFKSRPAKIFLISVIATAITVLPLPFMHQIAPLCIALFIAGIFYSPTMILAMQFVESVLPQPKLTEGLTWASASIGAGVAIGSAISGPILERWSTSAGFSIAIAGGIIILIAVGIGYPRLKRG